MVNAGQSPPLDQVTPDISEVMLREQCASLRALIPLMYALMLINSLFLAIATLHDVPVGLGLGVPAVLAGAMAIRAGIWLSRDLATPSVDQLKRYIRSTLWLSAILSAGFGGWGLLLYSAADPIRTTSVALYIFVGSISSCYCFQALPLAGRFVLLFGAMPVTVRLLLSDDWYLAGIGLTFLLVASVITRTLSAGYAAFSELLRSRTEMSGLLAALRQSEEHYRHSVDLNPQIPWIADASGAIVELGPRWSALIAIDVEAPLGAQWVSAVHGDDLPGVLASWAGAIRAAKPEGADSRYRLRHKDGSYRWYRARGRPRRDEDGTVVKWYGTLEDIDDQVVAEQSLISSEERYRLASQATNGVIFDSALDVDRIEWSGAVEMVFGDAEALKGTTRSWWMDRIHPDDRERLIARLRDIRTADKKQISQSYRFRAADGEYRNLDMQAQVVRDEHNRPVRLIGSMNDVTARKRYEADLKWMAHHDALTLLPNRTLFAERLKSVLGEAHDQENCVQLVVLDLDGFKAINDTMGHLAGDAILREVALRLTQQAPATATVARLGGDEFAIILPAVAFDDERVDIALLLQAINRPFFHDERRIEISLCAGSAFAFEDGNDPEDLHKAADLALYAAKTEGRGRIRRYEPPMRDAAESQKRMVSEARAALNDDRIVPFYQPKVCLRTGKPMGFEALLRWHHHGNGLQLPAAIGAAFHDPDLSVLLTNRMLDIVLTDMARWRDQGCDFGRIAVNGSSGDFRRGDFPDRILERMHRANLPPSLLELEVNETVFLGQQDNSLSLALATLSAAGVTIALDDFGTGYASLTHLQEFPVDTLKIDRSFVSRLGAGQNNDAAIVGAVIDLARNLEITTVAEGIETPVQAAHLIAKGCDVGQGYLFGRAMAGDLVADELANWSNQSVLARCRPAEMLQHDVR